MRRKKRQKFIELANKRMARTIKDLRLIGNLSNRAAYEYTDKDVQLIVRALHKEIETLRSRFNRTSEAGDSDFRLEM